MPLLNTKSCGASTIVVGLPQCHGTGFTGQVIGGSLMIMIGTLVGAVGVVSDQIIGGGLAITCPLKWS